MCNFVPVQYPLTGRNPLYIAVWPKQLRYVRYLNRYEMLAFLYRQRFRHGKYQPVRYEIVFLASESILVLLSKTVLNQNNHQSSTKHAILCFHFPSYISLDYYYHNHKPCEYYCCKTSIIVTSPGIKGSEPDSVVGEL